MNYHLFFIVDEALLKISILDGEHLKFQTFCMDTGLHLIYYAFFVFEHFIFKIHFYTFIFYDRQTGEGGWLCSVKFQEVAESSEPTSITQRRKGANPDPIVRHDTPRTSVAPYQRYLSIF